MKKNDPTLFPLLIFSGAFIIATILAAYFEPEALRNVGRFLAELVNRTAA